MKYTHTIVSVLMLFILFTTNVASAYSGPDFDTITSQIYHVLSQIKELITPQRENLSATKVTPAVSERTCVVNIYSKINNVTKRATTTMTGNPDDKLALGLSVGASGKVLPYSSLEQNGTAGKNNEAVTVGYFSPERYKSVKTQLDSLSSDPNYKFATVDFVNSTTGISSTSAFIDLRISNNVTKDLPANNVAILVNIHGCTNPPQNTKKPNILFIQADDLDMQTMEQLPRLKSLIADTHIHPNIRTPRY